MENGRNPEFGENVSYVAEKIDEQERARIYKALGTVLERSPATTEIDMGSAPVRQLEFVNSDGHDLAGINESLRDSEAVTYGQLESGIERLDGGGIGGYIALSWHEKIEPEHNEIDEPGLWPAAYKDISENMFAIVFDGNNTFDIDYYDFVSGPGDTLGGKSPEDAQKIIEKFEHIVTKLIMYSERA